MTSDIPPISPEMQAQAPATVAPNGTGSGHRPWLEPAVVVAVIGVAVTIFGLLLSIVFGIYSMNNHIDALGSELKADIRDLNNRMDTLGSEFKADIRDLNARVDALGSDLNARIDALGSDLNARIDALGSDFNIRIEQVYQLLLPEER